MIRIDRERYLKHTITNLETLNKPSSTYLPVLGNYSCDSHFRNFSSRSSDVPLTWNSEMTFQEELPTTVVETLFYQELALKITELAEGKEEINREGEVDTCFPAVWTLYIDGSKSQ
jgi:hypothetical protein